MCIHRLFRYQYEARPRKEGSIKQHICCESKRIIGKRSNAALFSLQTIGDTIRTCLGPRAMLKVCALNYP